VSEDEDQKEVRIKSVEKVIEKRGPAKVIILDSSAYSYPLRSANYIPFPIYEGDEKDPALFYLSSYLKEFADLEDV
jgi:TFIIF-interacting CTD phosphatase-like protein